ncbi:MAG TPA: hypothetical protein VFV58_13135 [Blastocatellia bacterium]|jgi:hypothetical protein|nr:hypothetical protein [Blastocatellia bacterium]
MPIRGRREGHHKLGEILISRLRNTYGDNVAVGCRSIAAIEIDEDEKAFWLDLADELERRQKATRY